MFGFSDDIPFEKLINQEVAWICFAIREVSIKSRGGDEIIIYNADEFFSRNGMSNSDGISFLLNLIESIISNVSIINGAYLNIEFGDRGSIAFHDRINDFENFCFIIDRVEYIV